MTWMTLKSSVVIFQDLEPLQPQWPLHPKKTSMASMTSTASFHQKKTLIPIVGSFLAYWPILVSFCWTDLLDHQTPNFSLISDILSVGGCWGQQMLLFWKLVDETQMVKPPEPTRHHNLRKYLILLPLRAIFRSLYYETPCTLFLLWRESKKILTAILVCCIFGQKAEEFLKIACILLNW